MDDGPSLRIEDPYRPRSQRRLGHQQLTHLGSEGVPMGFGPNLGVVGRPGPVIQEVSNHQTRRHQPIQEGTLVHEQGLFQPETHLQRLVCLVPVQQMTLGQDSGKPLVHNVGRAQWGT